VVIPGAKMNGIDGNAQSGITETEITSKATICKKSLIPKTRRPSSKAV
jgi:hypothetical protein